MVPEEDAAISERAESIHELLKQLCFDEEPTWSAAYDRMKIAYAQHSTYFSEEDRKRIETDPALFDLLISHEGLIASGVIAAFSHSIDLACRKIAKAEAQVPIMYEDYELPAALVMAHRYILSPDKGAEAVIQRG